MAIFQNQELAGCWLGRVERPAVGVCVVTLRGERVFDITCRAAPTVRDVLELADPVSHVRTQPGADLGSLDDLAAATLAGQGPRLLAPCDLQAIKACGVTFASSMVERMIEEKAAGDPARAAEIRDRMGAAIGGSLRNVRAGSPEAAAVKAALLAEGAWSQYLEVGIGPDAEVFSKAQPMSAVGWGADVGLHPISKWNNPEPEVVLAVNSCGQIVGATLGNDVNLRDIEGRSALLLGKAKDNNASASIGPMIRLFDPTWSLDDVRAAELEMTVEGLDGYVLKGASSMREISRDPEDLVRQTIGRHHQYPDGLMLYLGTLFAPTEDRDAPGEGFTHKIGDVVTISAPGLGALRNTVRLSGDCPEWTFGTAALMRDLAQRNLL